MLGEVWPLVSVGLDATVDVATNYTIVYLHRPLPEVHHLDARAVVVLHLAVLNKHAQREEPQEQGSFFLE